MANKVVIDVEARFIDNVSGKSASASNSIDKIGKSADQAQKKLDNLSKKKAKPIFDADNNKFLSKIRSMEAKMNQMGHKKTAAVLDLVDKATTKIGKVVNAVQKFVGKTWRGMLEFKDSNALATIRKVTSAAEGLTKKTWSAMVKVKDMALAPIRAIKNALFSIPTLITTVISAKVVQKAVLEPMNLADQYTNAKIGFTTLLGESEATKMMSDIDAFAAATPFKTSNVISNIQKMMAYGWDAKKTISDMQIIGDAAAATGKGDEGLTSIVYALSEIRSKGKLSTQELNQLASAGIKAKAYLAQGLGYGTDDAGLMMLAKDLEAGAIGANQAVELILEGMKEFSGMMDKTANETVKGLKDQLEDLFEINVARRWGQGLQDGTKRALKSVVGLLDDADEALGSFGDSLYEVGKNASNWMADRFENAVGRIMKITDTWEFQNADFGEKISMLWNGAVVDPLKSWWEGGGQEKTAKTAGKIGKWIGKTLSTGLLTLFGAAEGLSGMADGAKSGGASIAESFVQGFVDNFDAGAIASASVDAIKGIWNALPGWGKVALGLYGGGKALSGLGNVVGGLGNFFGGIGNMWKTGKALIGTPGNYMAKGTGLSSLLASLGYGAVGKLSGVGGAGLAGMSGGTAALAGAGLLTSAVGVLHVGSTLHGAIKDYKAGDKASGDANLVRAGSTAAGIGVGALAGAKIGTALGTVVPGAGNVVGGLVGAGIGTVVGWVAGDTIAKNMEKSAFQTERMKNAIDDSEISTEALNNEFEKAKWEIARDAFGDIALSMSEIQRLANQIVWGDDLQKFEKFSTAAKNAESSLQTMKTASEDMSKWMWKAGFGVKFNGDEQKAIVASVDEYINSAKSFLENKHYEFTMSADLLLDLESDEGKAILEGGNAFYLGKQEELDKLTTDLRDKIQKALEDGVISTEPVTLPDGTIQLSEMDEILNLQQQIANITDSISNAEYEAKLDVIKLKWGDGNLDSASFQNFMDYTKTSVEERASAALEALEIQVANLKMRFPEGGAEYEAQLKTLFAGYTAKIDSVKAEIMDVEVDVIGNAWNNFWSKSGSDKLFGGNLDSAKNAVSKALTNAIQQGIDSTEILTIDGSKLMSLLEVDPESFSMSTEVESLMKEHLSGVLSQMEVLEVDGNLLLKIGQVSTSEGTTEKVKEAVDNTVPETTEAETNVNVTANPQTAEGTTEKVKSAVEATIPQAVEGNTTVTVIPNPFYKPTVLEAMGMVTPPTGPANIPVDVDAQQGSIKTIKLSPEDLVTMSSLRYSPTITISPNYVISPTTIPTGSLVGPRRKNFRGGIVGGSSAMASFYRGGIAGYSDGGMVRGGSQLIEVAEEGSPEMIIPLSSQRRGRALKLWAQAGNMMGVPGFARGGMTSGGSDEGFRFQSYDSGESSSSQTVQIDVGGITFEINVNGDNPQSIVESIKAQAEEIAEVVAGVLADSLSSQFQNMPTRGGVA